MNNITDSEGNIGSHIKIIRNESIGNYSLDNKASGVGSSTTESGSNDWSDSTLMEVLNNGAYYNKTSGNCPYGKNGVTTTCDFSESGLTNESKSMISNVVWHLGGWTTETITASDLYTYEKGTAVYSGHTTTWIGKVGLMYPSDYGYAVGGSVRNTCLTSNIGAYNMNNCYTNNWLYNESYQWTLTPYSNYADSSFGVSNSGNVGNFIISNSGLGVRPALYLNSNVEITDGDGSEQNPFQLQLP